MNEKRLKRTMRRDISSYGWALMIYYLLMNACVNAAVLLDMVFRIAGRLASGDLSGMDVMDEAAVLGNGWGYLAACILAVCFIRLWKGKAVFRGLWKTDRTMKPASFFQLVCVFISGQFLFQVCATIQELILNLFGLSVLEAMTYATVNTDTISMFLYTALGAPIVEEIIFRGLILRGLEKYGKRFAILISAILFGLFHGNLVQSPYAFTVGLVLGYVALEYNIGWAMVLHMVNNLLLGDTLPRLLAGLGELGSSLVIQLLIILCSVAAVVILLCKRRKIRAYLRQEEWNWDAWWAFCTAPGVIVMFVFMEISAFSMLF